MKKENPRDTWRTPPLLAAKLVERYRLTSDLAADRHNYVCDLCFTRDIDALTCSWAGHRAWCNPPYSNTGAWVRKAVLEARGGRAFIVMLIPANVGDGWFREVIAHSTWFAFDRRIRFVAPKGVQESQPRFGNVLAVFSGDVGRFGGVLDATDGSIIDVDRRAA